MAESKWSGTGTSGTGIIPPSSATDNAVVRWNGTDGTTVQDSVVLIGDTGAVTGVTTLAASGAITGSNLSGTNTGDQTISLTGDVTGSGTGSFVATIGAGKVTNTMLATASSAANNSYIVARNVVGNSNFNNIGISTTSTVSAAQTVTMTYASTGNQRITGTSTVRFKLPDATYLTAGDSFKFNNNSTGIVSVYKADNTTLVSDIPGGGLMDFLCMDNSTTNGLWDYHAYMSNAATSGTTGTSLPGTLTTGVISNALGAIGAPSYTFTGDLNTGMWSSGADTLDFSTAGARGLQIGSVGQLIMGIGTTATTTGHTAQSATATNTSNFRILNRNGSAARAGLLFSPASGTDGADFLIDTTGGYHWKNASNTEIGDVSNAGAWTLGATSASLTHTFQSGGNTLVKATTAAASEAGFVIERTVNTAVFWEMYSPAGSTDLRFYSTADMGKVTAAGAWTLGPASSVNQNLIVNGTMVVNHNSTDGSPAISSFGTTTTSLTRVYLGGSGAGSSIQFLAYGQTADDAVKKLEIGSNSLIFGTFYATAQLGMAANSASAPGYSWVGDLDTGMYRAGTNSIGFSTNGTNVGTISSTGAWTLGPAAGLSTGAAAYHTVYGSTVGILNSGSNRACFTGPLEAAYGANFYRDGAATAKAVGAGGASYIEIVGTTTPSTVAFYFETTTTSQTANTAHTNVIQIATATAAGAWTFGWSTLAAAAHQSNGAITMAGQSTTAFTYAGSAALAAATDLNPFFYRATYPSTLAAGDRAALVLNSVGTAIAIGNDYLDNLVFGKITGTLGRGIIDTRYGSVSTEGAWELGMTLGSTAPSLPFKPLIIQTPITTTIIGYTKFFKFGASTTVIDLVTISSASWDVGHNIDVEVQVTNIATNNYSLARGHARGIGSTSVNTITTAMVATDANNGLGLGTLAWTAGTGAATLQYTPPTNTDYSNYEITITNRKFPFTLP